VFVPHTWHRTEDEDGTKNKKDSNLSQKQRMKRKLGVRSRGFIQVIDTECLCCKNVRGHTQMQNPRKEKGKGEKKNYKMAGGKYE